MKKIIYITLISLGFVFISSCTKNFEDINTNPNFPDQAPLTNVFANVIEDISERFGTTEMEYAAAYVGHVTKGTYTEVTTYMGTPSSSVWNGSYRSTLSNANYVLDGAKEEGNNNLLGATMVLRAYALHMVTDVYGPVPYSQAGMATEGIIHPVFDNEADIYNDLLLQLDDANDLLIDEFSNGYLGDGDLLYHNNITKWKKFCNSLHLRVAIRMSNVDEAKAKAEIEKILSNPDKYPIFESNSENALLGYPGEDWVEPWTARHASIGDDWIAKPIVDTLLSFGDPRIEFYAATLEDGTYSGLTVGEDADTVYSRVNDLFVNNPTGNVYYLKYAEVELIKAEAAMRWGIGSAKDAYETAITASCEEYGIDAATIATYLEGDKVAWNDDLNQIYIQSWEAWAEMRRTDIPTLGPAANAAHTGHNRPPFRFSYPDTEKNLNGNNIPTFVNEKDNYWGYQVWWDTRTGVQ